MKKIYISIIVMLGFALTGKAQKIDSIYFNLYTDSLKKGAVHYNYINVDGKLSDGRFIPLDTIQIRFTASVGKMKGNVLMLDSATKEEFVIVTAMLKDNPAVRKETKIWIKRNYTEENLKSEKELIEGWQNKKKN